MMLKRFRNSGVYLILLVLSLLLSMVGILIFEGVNRNAADSARLDPMQLGDVLAGRLQRDWLSDDLDSVDQMILDIGEMPNVRDAHIIDCRFQVISTSEGINDAQNTEPHDTQASGCIECHQYGVDTRPRAVQLEEMNIVRISTPIGRPQGFDPCEAEDLANMGVLLIDVPFTGSGDNSYLNMAGSVLSLLLMGLSVYLIVNYLVLRRLTEFHQPLSSFTAGELTSRVPITSGMSDELRTLAGDVNASLERYEHHFRDIEEKNSIYQRIVFEERERIARDLHDGLAQILTFINTKSAALRMMIQNNDVAPAVEQLRYLEEEAQNLLVDVRMTIWGLRAADRLDTNLVETLQNFASRFSNVSQLPVELTVAPDVEDFVCDADMNLQLFRIVQEALTNVHKHAEATNAWISLQRKDGCVYLIVGDNGGGFDVANVEDEGWHHFGLTTMQERAKSIGADFSIISEFGAGTQVIVKVPAED
jgi:signal transduction histidine kinase